MIDPTDPPAAELPIIEAAAAPSSAETTPLAIAAIPPVKTRGENQKYSI